MGKDITWVNIAVVGVQEIGQIVFGSSYCSGTSPDLHKLSISAGQLCLLPLLLAPVEQVDVKHRLEQLNHPDDSMADLNTETLQSVHTSSTAFTFFFVCCRFLNL